MPAPYGYGTGGSRAAEAASRGLQNIGALFLDYDRRKRDTARQQRDDYMAEQEHDARMLDLQDRVEDRRADRRRAQQRFEWDVAEHDSRIREQGHADRKARNVVEAEGFYTVPKLSPIGDVGGMGPPPMPVDPNAGMAGYEGDDWTAVGYNPVKSLSYRKGAAEFEQGLEQAETAATRGLTRTGQPLTPRGPGTAIVNLARSEADLAAREIVERNRQPDGTVDRVGAEREVAGLQGEHGILARSALNSIITRELANPPEGEFDLLGEIDNRLGADEEPSGVPSLPSRAWSGLTGIVDRFNAQPPIGPGGGTPTFPRRLTPRGLIGTDQAVAVPSGPPSMQQAPDVGFVPPPPTGNPEADALVAEIMADPDLSVEQRNEAIQMILAQIGGG